MKHKNLKIKLRIPISNRAPKVEKSKSSYSRREKYTNKKFLFGNNLTVRLY